MNEGFLFLGAAILLDVIANICLKKSDGFHHKTWGMGAVMLIIAAFMLMAQAVRSMELSVAYALWGALGLILTTGLDVAFYGVRLNRFGVAGIVCMLTGIVLLKSVA